MRGLRSCGAGDGEPQPELTEMFLLPLFINILGAFVVSCLDVHLGTGRMQQRASRKQFPMWVGASSSWLCKGRQWGNERGVVQ